MAKLEVRTLTRRDLADFFAKVVADTEIDDETTEARARTFARKMHQYAQFEGRFNWYLGSSELFPLKKGNGKFNPDYFMRVLPPGDWNSFLISVNENRVPVQLISGENFEEGILCVSGRNGERRYFLEGFHLSDIDEFDYFDFVDKSRETA